MSKNRRYTDEFKREVLAMATSGEKSIPQLARDLGIQCQCNILLAAALPGG